MRARNRLRPTWLPRMEHLHDTNRDAVRFFVNDLRCDGWYVDLTGPRVLVTGGGAGLERETARALAAIGAEVTIAARSIDAGR